ncbi:MAG: cytidylate kinase family protein [Desulfobacterota bacterium]|jgi:cytidylate kinase|nr:cytidylate kinase family protein [Thermodesulfobacteriota bacterium]
MPIITISRGTLSGGEALANLLSEKTGYPVVGLEVIKDAATRFGISEGAISKQLSQGPRVIERIAGDKRRIYLSAVQSALAERALQGDFIYHGLAGQFLLVEVPNVLKVRLVAPLTYRVKSVVEKKGFTEQEAIKYIQNVDEKRMQWTRFLYDVDWTDPMLYDMVINLDQVTLDTACGLILYPLDRPEFKDSPEKQRAIRDFALSCQVTARLALDERTRGVETSVEAREGKVSVRGRVFTTSALLATGMQSTKAHIHEVVKGIPGVKELTIDISESPIA